MSFNSLPSNCYCCCLNNNPLFIEFQQAWHQYATDFKRRCSRYLNLKMELGGMYHDFEAFTLYCIIRKIRPKIIFEISPFCGYSTLFMATACQDNDVGKILSFEIEKNNVTVARQVLTRYGLEKIVDFVVGDARQTLLQFINESKDVDFIFIDSLHTYSFFDFLLSYFAPAIDNGVLVHVHDINYSLTQGLHCIFYTHLHSGIYGAPRVRFLEKEAEVKHHSATVWNFLRPRNLVRVVKNLLRGKNACEAIKWVSAEQETSEWSRGEHLRLLEFLEANPEVDWLSLMHLVQIPCFRDYLWSQFGISTRGTPETEGSFYFERNPTLYFRKKVRRGEKDGERGKERLSQTICAAEP